MSATKLIFGLGTGRCGMSAVARLLNCQPNCEVFHDFFGYDLPATGGDTFVAAFLERAHVSPHLLVGDVFSAWLYYVEQILEAAPETRFLCMKRDRAGTVKSFDRWSGPRNFWTAHDGREWQADVWDHCFPDFPAVSKAESIGLYWDDYYQRAEAFAEALPERFRVFDMSEINSVEGQRRIAAFCGIDGQDYRALEQTRHNQSAGAQHLQP